MRPRRQQPTRLPRPWDSPGKNWSGKVAQLCPILWDPMDYTVNGNLQARKLEWVAVCFSRGSSQPRDRTKVSWIAGGFFTNWAIRETCILNYFILKICHMKILTYWSIWNWGGLILLLDELAWFLVEEKCRLSYHLGEEDGNGVETRAEDRTRTRTRTRTILVHLSWCQLREK